MFRIALRICMFWSAVTLPHPPSSSSPRRLKNQLLCAGNIQGKGRFQNLTPTSEQVNLCFTAAFYGERIRRKSFCMSIVSPVTPPEALAIPHSATYPMQPPPSARYRHLLLFLLLVRGTPLPEFSDPLDLSVCIFPSLPLSIPSCTRSACLYCCHSPIPPSVTQSHARCPLPFPSIYFCAHEMAVPGDLLLYLPLQ